MPSRRKPIIWSFSRRSATSALKARASTPISSRPWTATPPVYEPSRIRSTSPTSLRTGPVMRDAATHAATRPSTITPSETTIRLLRKRRNETVSADRLRSASAAPTSWSSAFLSGMRIPM